MYRAAAVVAVEVAVAVAVVCWHRRSRSALHKITQLLLVPVALVNKATAVQRQHRVVAHPLSAQPQLAVVEAATTTAVLAVLVVLAAVVAVEVPVRLVQEPADKAITVAATQALEAPVAAVVDGVQQVQTPHCLVVRQLAVPVVQEHQTRLRRDRQFSTPVVAAVLALQAAHKALVERVAAAVLLA